MSRDRRRLKYSVRRSEEEDKKIVGWVEEENTRGTRGISVFLWDWTGKCIQSKVAVLGILQKCNLE